MVGNEMTANLCILLSKDDGNSSKMKSRNSNEMLYIVIGTMFLTLVRLLIVFSFTKLYREVEVQRVPSAL